MLVQSLVIINGGAATAVRAYYGAHNASGLGRLAALLTIISPLELAALASRSFFAGRFGSAFASKRKYATTYFSVLKYLKILPKKHPQEAKQVAPANS